MIFMAFYLENYPRVVQLNELNIIIYVDEGWGKENLAQVEPAIIETCKSNPDFVKNAAFLIAFLWKKENFMFDVWKFSDNPVDDLSGPLVDMRVFKGTEIDAELGVASGNTLLVLGLEEMHRRNSVSIESFLSTRPELPVDLIKD